ncbi:PTS lactose/cellobiose transporter subunit IIA [Spiroplasma endosymbiont of Aspidapion aeneum]|uniref:PTS lactose/cellobiose transporter subunit IIA n=1 Tax=Spiroplasma endosymbiont of Aspidapion aeneum TaxID=3066276 RepID=UPI00313E44A9
MNNKVSTTDISMELISYSGESKATALKAIKFAKKGDFVEANKLIASAKEMILNVHRIHAEIIQTEASGKEYDINTLFIHAQDHFMSALTVNELAETIVILFERLNEGGKK